MFIVMEIQTNYDGSVGNLVYAYPDRPAAESKYHLILASAAITQLPCHAAVLMTNEGEIIYHKAYHTREETD